VAVTAVVLAGGASAPVDVLAPVRGVPMVAFAVRALLATGLVECVNVLDLGSRRRDVEKACSGLSVQVHEQWPLVPVGVSAHDRQRANATCGDGPLTVRGGDLVLLHDAARPLAPATLALAVVEAVERGHDMAVPVLPLTDTVKRVDAGGLVVDTPDRAGLRVLQTPIATRSGLIPHDLAADPLDVVRLRTAVGGVVHAVPGHPAAFGVRSAWDLELAQLLAERTITP
jgi:2-C-methyl-D-erythritol 4-phosphate cytidylyltransferase